MSKTNEIKPHFEFINQQHYIQEMLKELLKRADNHFNYQPEEVNWNTVGTISSVMHDLELICEKLGIEPGELI